MWSASHNRDGTRMRRQQAPLVTFANTRPAEGHARTAGWFLRESLTVPGTVVLTVPGTVAPASARGAPLADGSTVRPHHEPEAAELADVLAEHLSRLLV